MFLCISIGYEPQCRNTIDTVEWYLGEIQTKDARFSISFHRLIRGMPRMAAQVGDIALPLDGDQMFLPGRMEAIDAATGETTVLQVASR